jgi:hypothetical protein
MRPGDRPPGPSHKFDKKLEPLRGEPDAEKREREALACAMLLTLLREHHPSHERSPGRDQPDEGDPVRQRHRHIA